MLVRENERLNRELAEKDARVAALAEQLATESASKVAAETRALEFEQARVNDHQLYEASTKAMSDEVVFWRWLMAGIVVCIVLLIRDANFDRRLQQRNPMANVVPMKRNANRETGKRRNKAA